MKHKYRNLLLGTVIATILGATGAAIAHGGAYGGNMQQGVQAQPGCAGSASRPGMTGGMHQGMGHGGMMGGMHQGKGHGAMMGGMHHGMGPGGMMGGMHQGKEPGGMMGGMQHGMGPGAMMGGMQHGMGPGGMMGKMGSALDLSAEQQAEMSKIRDEMLPLMGELHGRMQANHEQMQALTQSGDGDQAAIGKLADQKGDLIAEMIKLRSQLQARMQSVLSDEQREQMRQHRQGMGMMGG